MATAQALFDDIERAMRNVVVARMLVAGVTHAQAVHFADTVLDGIAHNHKQMRPSMSAAE
jgi:hypothetical protein